jgi:UDP-2,3-diacylglucosamine pyrophosphatase LpxH
MGLMQKKFSKLFKRANHPDHRMSFNALSDRYVVISDHHKGDASAADDFYKNAAVYQSALEFYADEGFQVLVLGDSEELWENTYTEVRAHYKELIRREVALAPKDSKQRPLRIWGNHDKEFSLRRLRENIQQDPEDPLFSVQFKESLCLGPDIFLIHGHQGRFFEDQAWRLSRWAVQFVWKTIQRLFHIGNDGPAENVKVREGLEVQYYRWAKEHGVLLICGHTHRAVFASQTHYNRLQKDLFKLESQRRKALADLSSQQEARIQQLKAGLNSIEIKHGGRAPRSFADPKESALPCYFNSGCCGYINGITCIEIAEGDIRLIKWQRDPRERKVLMQDKLQDILTQIKTGQANTP